MFSRTGWEKMSGESKGLRKVSLACAAAGRWEERRGNKRRTRGPPPRAGQGAFPTEGGGISHGGQGAFPTAQRRCPQRGCEGWPRMVWALGLEPTAIGGVGKFSS